MLMPGLMPGPPGAGGSVGAGDGLGIGAALTASIPNTSGDTATPAAIAAALATRLRFIGFRFPRRLSCAGNVLVSGYPANAQTNRATPRNDVAIGLTMGRHGFSVHMPHGERRLERSARRLRRCGTSGALRQ